MSKGLNTVKYTLDYIDHSTKYISNPAHGEFIVHKAFQVTPSKESKVYGYVIQLVQKVTEAYTIENKNTPKKIENISTFTDDYVNYMNDSYFELFFIVNGESTDGDNFQNGAILKYTAHPNDPSDVGPDDKIPTKGTIKVTGTSWFIPATQQEVEAVIKTIAAMQSKMNVNSNRNKKNNTIDILGLEWSLNPNTPANGLPYIEWKKRAEVIGLGHASNILEHNVEVKWNSTKSTGKTKGKSIIKSTFKSYA
jgi:hypothetical protein